MSLTKKYTVEESTVPEAGLGLFSKITLKKGDHIGDFTGMVFTEEELDLSPYADSHYILWVCQNCIIVGEGKDSNITRYINHSDSPNAEMVTSTRWKKARFRALKTIRPGQEIFIDYGPEYFEE